MPSSLARQVAARFQDRPATVVHRDGDLTWGWSEDSPPRMHLTLVSPAEDGCIVWLEDRGRRICSARRCPPGSTIPLASWVASNREWIEQRWLKFMEVKSWLSVRVTDDQLVLVCYPGEETEFVRPINLPVWTDRELRSRSRSESQRFEKA